MQKYKSLMRNITVSQILKSYFCQMYIDNQSKQK